MNTFSQSDQKPNSVVDNSQRPSVDAEQTPLPENGPCLPFSFAKRHQLVLSATDTLIYTATPSLNVLAEAQRLAGKNLRLQAMETEAFQSLLTLTYERDSSEAMQMVEDLGDDMDLTSLANAVPETEDLLEQEDDAPIIRLINALLSEAIKINASDIHIETFENKLVVRFRVDGVLREVVRPKRELAPLLVSRIKVMSKLDIAEKRVPQDGRISLKVGGREVDIRVSTMPSSSGERVVLRLLDKQAGRLNLTSLGMQPDDEQRFEQLLHKPHGIILVTGPTGSGKTTSLYAGLASINDENKNILTVEDPIEYNLEGIGQTQVNVKADMTFARGLRAMLRQDPDVVMVGEIRDLETVEIAIQASLTGHLVLSTLHTNTAVGAVTRLVDMGVEPFLLSSSVIGIIAQRLVRLLCPHCKQSYQADTAECELLALDSQHPAALYKAVGCEQCNHQGYRGRTGIYELIVVDDALKALIHNRASEAEMIKHVRRTCASIRDDGRARIISGDTSVEEVLRVTHED